MRELSKNEIINVSGGADAVQAAANMCRTNNLAPSTKVTISITVGGSIGAGSTNTTNQTVVTIETTCGALTKKN